MSELFEEALRPALVSSWEVDVAGLITILKSEESHCFLQTQRGRAKRPIYVLGKGLLNLTGITCNSSDTDTAQY